MNHVRRTSQGTGQITCDELSKFGQGSVLESGVLVFHPHNVEIGENVYIGHDTILKGYHINKLVIGDGSWIGQQCLLNSAGGIAIGRNVGIGPGTKIITSFHLEEGIDKPILHCRLGFAPVAIEDDADIGVGTIILPGVTIGRGVQVGAGSVVTHNVADYDVVAGVPARTLRNRRQRGAT